MKQCFQLYKQHLIHVFSLPSFNGYFKTLTNFNLLATNYKVALEKLHNWFLFSNLNRLHNPNHQLA